MKRLLFLLVLLAICVAVGFVLGRLTAAPPQYTPAAGGTDLGAAFEDFQQAQQQTLELMLGRPQASDPQLLAEAYQGLLYTIVGSIKAAALMDHEYPRLMRAVDWTSKAGLDNPDNDYYIALLRDDRRYRLRGHRGTTSDLVFQLVVGQPGVRGAGSSTNVSVLEGRNLQLADDGSFEVIISSEDPGPDSNWLPNGPGAETLLIRKTYSDWSTERSEPFTIEEIGREGASRPPLSPAVMASRLRNVAVHMYDRTATWMDFADKAWLLRGQNAITQARPSRGGLVGQWSAFGSWELENDEALILRSHPSNAVYQGIELGNRWFVSLDYETRTSSRTLEQAVQADDGSYYFVISHRDPGVPNWLDTGDHRTGLIMLRWQGLEGELGDDQQPTAQKVRFDELDHHLPAGIPRVTPAQRRAEILARSRAVQARD